MSGTNKMRHKKPRVLSKVLKQQLRTTKIKIRQQCQQQKNERNIENPLHNKNVNSTKCTAIIYFINTAGKDYGRTQNVDGKTVHMCACYCMSGENTAQHNN